MKQIKPVLEGIYKDLSLRKRVVPIFMGNPGLGKTFLVNEFVQFANENKVNFIDFFNTNEINPKVIEYIGSQVSPLEISGIGIPDKDLKTMVYYNFDKLTKLKDGDILFFDELPNSNPSVFNALLTLIENRVMMSGDKLPDIMIIAAGNYQGLTPMTPQIKRRFIWYDVKFNSDMWKNFMLKKYNMPFEISNKLCELIKNEEFTGYNFNTPADLDKATEMIIKNVYTPYEKMIKPILQTLIENKDEDILLSECENRIWKLGEMISWLELIKYKFNITNNKKTEIINDFNILILDENNEVIGKIKNIEILKKLYYFNELEINDILNGVPRFPPATRCLPSDPFRICFKLNI